MSWKAHWRGVGMMLDTQKQGYSLLGGNFEVKKQTGAGYKNQNIWVNNCITLYELGNSPERC
jgi:hypothetical protein